ncbi:MAG: hypothetical protein O3C40_08115 [Planctomycetota bacterium]|nr:hypothetical protein [Planctomycetota bacterium]
MCPAARNTLFVLAIIGATCLADTAIAAESHFSAAAIPTETNSEDASTSLTAFGSANDPSCGCSACCADPWTVSRDPIFCYSYLDCLSNLGGAIDNGCNFKMPITGGAWHWFHQNLNGGPGGYGIPGLRGTYFWYLYADPQYTTGAGNTIGGHMELRLRETETFRTFVDDQVWTWELYGYIQNDELGTLKAGQLYNRFGIFWDGVFFGNASYFDGMKLDADYGVSWEKTTDIHDCLKVDSYVQYFFHEDQSNGSFGGADAESVDGYTEKNTGVARLVPTWTRADGSQLAIGASGMVGQIDSQIALPDETVWAYGVDATYTKGPWKAFVEGSQTYGVRNPVSYVSGGPSDQLTNFLGGIHYTRGAVTYRCSYSNSIYEHPHAVQNMVLAGATVTLTDHVDLYIEYVNQRVDGASLPGRNGDFFNSIEWVINWHF